MQSDADVPVESLGRYRLLRKLARGGMAEVFAARSYGAHGFEKTVAIKCILPKFGQDPQFVRMLVDEAKISVLLNHPNIAQILELGEHQGNYFIVMEFCAGQSLSTILKRLATEGTLMPRLEACFVVVGLLQGLHAAHVQRDTSGKPAHIIHRDVSPQNTLITFDGHVKVIDFGIARARDRLEATEVGTIKGKLRYLAPEMIDPIRFMKSGDFDHRVDVFAAGIVLWEMLAGRTLFEGEDELKVYELITDGVTPDLAKEGRCDKPLMDILHRALHRDPMQRYPSAEAFADDLRAYVYRNDPSFNVKRIASIIDRVCATERDDLLALERQPDLVVPASRPLLPAPAVHSDATGTGTGVFTGSRDAHRETAALPLGSQAAPVTITQAMGEHPDFPLIAEREPMRASVTGPGTKQSFSGPNDVTMATLVSRGGRPTGRRDSLTDHTGNTDQRTHTGGTALNTDERAALGRERKRPWLPIAVGALMAVLLIGVFEYKSRKPARPATAHVNVKLADVAAGGMVTIDGVQKTTPATFELVEGKHAVDVVVAGAAPYHSTVQVSRGVDQTIEVKPTWDRVPVEVVITPASVVPLVVLTLDDTPVTPTTTVAPRKGVKVAARAPGHRPYNSEVDVEPQQPLRLRIELEPIPVASSDAADVGASVDASKQKTTNVDAPIDATPKPADKPPANPTDKPTDKPDRPRDKTRDKAQEDGPSRPRGVGTLVLKTLPYWANVVIDGKRYDETTPFTIELKAGTHNVELTHPPKGLSKRLRVVVKSGESVTRTIQFE
jgi:serine/threonine protein kinase